MNTSTLLVWGFAHLKSTSVHLSVGGKGAASGASPFRAAGFGDVVVVPSFAPFPHGGGGGLPAGPSSSSSSSSSSNCLQLHAASLGAIHRKWCLRLARDLARAFGR